MRASRFQIKRSSDLTFFCYKNDVLRWFVLIDIENLQTEPQMTTHGKWERRMNVKLMDINPVTSVEGLSYNQQHWRRGKGLIISIKPFVCLSDKRSSECLKICLNPNRKMVQRKISRDTKTPSILFSHCLRAFVPFEGCNVDIQLCRKHRRQWTRRKEDEN